MNLTLELRASIRKMLPVTGISKALLLIPFTMLSLQAASPAAGDLMLLVAGASASNTTGTVVEINTTSAAQSAIQTITLPATGSPAYRMSGSATSTGYVALSNDRSLLAFTGVNSADTTSNVNTLNPRGVYTIDSSGAVALQTSYTGTLSGNPQTRGATTINGTTWFIADQNGLYTNGSTSTSPSGNFRSAKSFGGTVYVFTASTSAPPVGTMSAATGGTYTALPGLPNGTANMQDFYLIQSGANGTTYDVLYVLSTTSATAGTIAKYSLVSNSWVANSSYTTNFGGFGLAAKSGSGANLYVTTGTGASTANRVISVTDTAGYNTNINVTTANNVTLYTAATGTIIKGLDFAPTAAVSAPGISQNPQSQTITSGNTATLSVTASGTATLTYQWYQGLAGDTSTPVGTNSSSFTTPALTLTTSYWVRVTNGQGSADSTTATVTVSATDAPGISQNPQSQTIASGQTATLSVTASGTAPLSYQWYQGTASVTTTPVGTDSLSFTTPALTVTTSYWVRVSNGAGSADSSTATITIPVSTPPSGSGSATPSSVPTSGTTTLSVNVTPGANPASTGLNVTGDLSSIGGSSTQAFTANGNTFSFSATVDAATTLGAKSLPITIGDTEGRSGTTSISLTVTAPLANSTVVISQVYGGGGNSGALYTNDFVQLFNRGTTTVDMTGWSLQYSSATGTGDWNGGRQPLGGTIAPGEYYLIGLASGGANGSPLPATNVSGSINMAQSAGKVALVDNGDLLTGTLGCPVSTHILDLVGYGSTANCWEGTATAAVSGNLTGSALFRKGAGATDTNDNNGDFLQASPPDPTRTAPIVPLPPNVFTTYPSSNRSDIPRDATIEVTFTQAVTLDPAWFNISCATTGLHNSATEAPDGINRWITPNTNFLAGEVCTATVYAAKVHDASTGSLSPSQDYTWSFTVASGAAPPEASSVHLLMGNPTSAITDINQPDNYLMSKPELALSYNRTLGRPNWVSWHLTNAWIPVSHPARVDTFRPDPAIPPDWYRVQSFDFSGSGFDRGHMMPNADREDTIPDNQATFLMSNMLAQSPDNNQGPWAAMENDLRAIVRNSTANEIYIVSGPAGTGGTGSNGAATTVAGGHVTVPSSTWKVALVLTDNATDDDESRVTCAATTIAVIMPNVQGIRSNDWHTYLTTVNAVETLTGYHFFTNLPQPIQNCIKAGTNGVNPKNDQTINFSLPASATLGASVPLQATSTSALPVTLTVISGPGTIVNGTTLQLTGAGSVIVQATQPGDVNYNAAPNVSQTIVVNQATATINVSGGTFAYDGNPHGLTGTASGVFGEDLASLLSLGSTFTIAPGGRAFWSFAGNANYLAASGSAVVTITQAGAPAVTFIPGNLVVAVEGNGVAGAGSGPYTDNQASPLTLFQYAPNGTASASWVSSLVFPQTGSGANLAVSGEYGSSSEGTLHLSGDGRYLSIAGYGINAAAFNANPASYGVTDPLKPGALAQSGSLTGASYTPVPRTVALIDPYGNVNSSTALFNVFNTNNPRSVFTADGMNIYISGQGTGNDLTGGVFRTTLGSSSATAITGATATSNNPPPATIAQDTRDVQIVGGQLYAAIDSKEGTGSNRDYIGTLGPAGTPPTGVVGAPVKLPGFATSSGKVTLTAATANGINSTGQEINLSPSGFFFADSSTLYVADSGLPKNDSVTNDSGGSTLGNGGLQKWVLNSGTWSLKYTLGLQNGLPLVANSSAAGVSGLYGLTGKVVGGEVLLYATTYSITDLDQTFLFGIGDSLAATTNPGRSFTQLAAAPADSNFKGVSFAPSAPSGGVTITSSPSGLAFTSAGTGCAPGSYTTPVTLIWTPGSTCTLTAASLQSGTPGTQYQFHQWEDGSNSAVRTVTAPSSPTVYSATFDTYYQLTTSASPVAGGTVTPPSGTFYAAGTVVNLQATANASYTFNNWTGTVGNAINAATTVTMNGPQSVTANFRLYYVLNASVAPANGGTITATVGGQPFSCSSTCSATGSGSSSLTLTATPAPGYAFSSWTGCTSSSGASCTVTLSGTVNVSAVFTSSTSLTYTQSALTLNRTTGYYTRSVTVTNSGSAIPASAYVADGLPAGVSLVNATGLTSATTPTGSPCLELGAIGANSSITATVQFSRTGTQTVTYTTRILGSGPR